MRQPLSKNFNLETNSRLMLRKYPYKRMVSTENPNHRIYAASPHFILTTKPVVINAAAISRYSPKSMILE